MYLCLSWPLYSSICPSLMPFKKLSYSIRFLNVSSSAHNVSLSAPCGSPATHKNSTAPDLYVSKRQAVSVAGCLQLGNGLSTSTLGPLLGISRVFYSYPMGLRNCSKAHVYVPMYIQMLTGKPCGFPAVN